MAKKHMLDFETDSKVTPELMVLKALGDAIVCIGMAPEELSLLDGTLQHLGYLIIDKVDLVVEALGVMKD